MGKLLTGAIYVLLVLVLIVSGILVLSAYRKYKQTKQEVHDLQHNASAVEKVAREKYHLCRDGEVIYIYSE